MPDNLTHTATKPATKNDSKEIQRKHNFYRVKLDRDGLYKGLQIIKARLIERLSDYNFFRIDLDNENSIFVETIDNKLRQVNSKIIIDRFLDEIEKLEPINHEFNNAKFETYQISVGAKQIKEALFEKLSEYFSRIQLERLRPNGEIKLKEHNKNEMFFFYKNNFVQVSSNGIEVKPYRDLAGLYIWETQQLEREYEQNNTVGAFQKFCYRISGFKDARGSIFSIKDIPADIQVRYNALKSIIGYSLHKYFETKLYSIIITDSRISDEDEANGRTGKTLWAKALGKMLNNNENNAVFCEINGKDFTDKDKHRYSVAGIETQLICINDLKKNSPVEIFFNDITEGITVDKKNEKPFRIKSKILISTNKTIKIEGESAKDRVRAFEFSDYFDSNYSPEMEYGHWMFTEWDKKEWNRFDTFILSCCKFYLTNGLIQPESINLHKRILIEHTCFEFVDFMDEIIQTGNFKYFDEAEGRQMILEDNFKLKEPVSKKALYESFILNYPDWKQFKLSQRKFTSWLRTYAKHNNFLPINKINNTEQRSNGQDYIVFIKIEK